MLLIVRIRLSLLLLAARPFTALLFVFLAAASAHSADKVDTAAITASIEQLLASQHTGDVSASTDTTTIGQLTLAQGVVQFYRTRNYAPVWSDARNVEQLLHEIEMLSDDGLNPDDYYLPRLRSEFAQLQASEKTTADSPAQKLSVERQAKFDLLATRAYLRSLGHLFRGKLNPATLEPQWNFPRNDMIANEAMKLESEGLEQHNLAQVYAHMRPQHIFYERARTALKKMRAIAAAGGWPSVATKNVLKPDAIDPAIPQLRQRLSSYLGSDYASPENPELYDTALATAARKFQREQYLTADGVIGPATLAALNVPVQARMDQLRVNLERGRWLLHDLKDDFVLVDIAGYKIYVYRQGKIVWRSIVQVGKPARSTPTFRSKTTYITFNPTWTVPPTIFRKDVIPKVKKNIAYLAENNIRVLDASGRELNPKTIDWDRPGNIVLRQDAGDDAALGKVVIRFPNPYSVFLHDTPHRELFSNEQRAFSSGCIRVERPLELVELLLNDSEKWNRQAIDDIIAKGETRNVNIQKPLPLLLAYWTVDLLSDGDVGFKPDIYKRDAPLLHALNTNW